MITHRKEGLSLELLERLRRLREEPTLKPDAPLQVLQLQSQIHQDLFDPELNVTTLKARCGLRDNNVTTLFRRITRRSIREYIEEERLRAAVLLLQKEALPVIEVGLYVGFPTPQTFYRAFRRRFECTPVEYLEDPYQTQLHPVAG